MNYVNKVIHTDYTSDPFLLFSSIINSIHDHLGSSNKKFCTQFTIETLRALKIAKPDVNYFEEEIQQFLQFGKQSYKYVLDDFVSKNGTGETSLNLYGWAYYSNEHYAKLKLQFKS